MYTITPICAATMPNVSKGKIFTYLVDLDVTLKIPILAYLIQEEEGETVIMVDAGIDPTNYEPERGIEDGDPDHLLGELEEQGVTPEDVDYVVMSHLHNDHVGHMDLFAESEFLVQRSELAACRDPLPHMTFTYADETAETVDNLDTTLVDGGYRLRDGIELLHTPGHTVGHQTVVVETRNGPHAVLTDLAYCRHNVEPGLSTIPDADGNEVSVTPTDQEFIAPGLHVDTRDCYESYERTVERVGPDGVLLGGHDAGVLGKSFPTT